MLDWVILKVLSHIDDAVILSFDTTVQHDSPQGRYSKELGSSYDPEELTHVRDIPAGVLLCNSMLKLC